MNAIDYDSAKKAIDEHRFMYMVEQFIRDWAPHDLRERDAFSSQLMVIVRQTHAEAVEPLMKHLSNAFAVMAPLTLSIKTPLGG